MSSIGIIAEYNPFHNGHLYHLNKIKEMYPNDTIVLILGGHFMQRGETSIINKWAKTSIALYYGIDIIVELPYPFASQAADLFAKGSIQLLNNLKVDKLIFGSESNDIGKLKKIADFQINNIEYQSIIKKNLSGGFNYPASLAKAQSSLIEIDINTPNDILGIAYIKEIMMQGAKIEPITIKRTNDYHSLDTNYDITSASSIRNAIRNKKDIKKLVPKETYKYLNDDTYFIEDYFDYLKYQIITNINHLNIFQTVDEGIENRIKKYIYDAKDIDDLINKIKTKRYTYNKIRRMLTHILCNFTKEEASKFKNIEYIRILGFSNKGQKYLNSIKKNINIPLLSKFSKNDNDMLALEFRTTCIYASILNNDKYQALIRQEFNKPFRK